MGNISLSNQSSSLPPPPGNMPLAVDKKCLNFGGFNTIDYTLCQVQLVDDDGGLEYGGGVVRSRKSLAPCRHSGAQLIKPLASSLGGFCGCLGHIRKRVDLDVSHTLLARSHSPGHATVKKAGKWTGKMRKQILVNHGSP